jgi:biopolymer transport protein ExbB/TolQ
MPHEVSGPIKIVVYALLFMFGRGFSVMASRTIRYWGARKQSRAFAPQATSALHVRELGAAITVAERNSESHVARVVGSGLLAFRSACVSLPQTEAIEVVTSSLQRTAAEVRFDLRTSLGSLASIASTAPLVGLLGTLIGILDAFKGCGMSKASCMAMVAGGLAESLVTTILGLFVAIPAVWCYNYLSNQMEGFEIERSNASLEFSHESNRLASVPRTILTMSSCCRTNQSVSPFGLAMYLSGLTASP